MNRAVVVLLVVAGPAAAAAEPAIPKDDTDQAPLDPTEVERAAKRPALAVAAAIFPGLLVHGSGHFVAGKRRTAKRLLAMEGVGLGLIVAGGVPLATTGAARRVSAPTIPLIVGGAGLFLLSWVADIYGSAGGGVIDSAPRLAFPDLEAELGYAYINDPQFDYSSFAVAAIEWRTGHWTLSPSAWIATDDDNQRLRFEVKRRLYGPGSKRPSGDGTMFEVGGAATYHRFGDERFQTSVIEGFVGGRLDLERLSASLGSSFADMGVGVGGQQVDYRLDGVSADYTDLLLARFAYGIYLGRPKGVNGELTVFYDHRRDDFAAGLSPGSRQGSGFAGHFGADLFLDVSERFGIAAELTAGAAFIARLGVRFRLGAGE